MPLGSAQHFVHGPGIAGCDDSPMSLTEQKGCGGEIVVQSDLYTKGRFFLAESALGQSTCETTVRDIVSGVE